jgi:hypothetical protein
MADSLQTILKVGAWGMIGGTAATGFMWYQAKKQAKKHDSWTPYVLAMFASPVTMFYGGITGAILKGAPVQEGVEVMVKAPYNLAKFTIQHGPQVLVETVKLPFRFANWLIT